MLIRTSVLLMEVNFLPMWRFFVKLVVIWSKDITTHCPKSFLALAFHDSLLPDLIYICLHYSRHRPWVLVIAARHMSSQRQLSQFVALKIKPCRFLHRNLRNTTELETERWPVSLIPASTSRGKLVICRGPACLDREPWHSHTVDSVITAITCVLYWTCP